MSDSGYAAPRGWARPATRGELRSRLGAGEACEVGAHVAESTAMMLRGWLDFSQFTVRPSDNDGWALFEPNATADRTAATAGTVGPLVGCPFCGNTPTLEAWLGGGPHTTLVRCINGACPATPVVTGATRPTTIRRWNTRAPNDQADPQKRSEA